VTQALAEVAMSLTLDQFRSDKTLMREVQKIQPIKEKALEVLDTEHVMNKGSSAGLPPDDKLIRLGEIQGYNKCLEVFNQLFEEPPQPRKEIKSTYEAEK
jgi:hypothetical protein